MAVAIRSFEIRERGDEMTAENQKPRRDVNVFIRILTPFLLIVSATLFAADGAPVDLSRGGDYKDLPKEQKAMLDDLEKRTFQWFLDSENTKIGVTPDHWDGSTGEGEFFASIASSGFGLTAYGIAVERGWMKRADAVKRTLTTLRFFHDAKQSDDADATGNHGFFYHFLDMQTGHRYGPKTGSSCRRSTRRCCSAACCSPKRISTRTRKRKRKSASSPTTSIAASIGLGRSRARRSISMGWTPEAAIHPRRLAGLQRSDDAVCARARLADASYRPGRVESVDANLRRVVGHVFRARNISASRRLFGHQYSHVWIDFRGIQDEYMREHGIDYFDEQPPRRVCAARIRDPQSDGLDWLRPGRVGPHRVRRPASRPASG